MNPKIKHALITGVVVGGVHWFAHSNGWTIPQVGVTVAVVAGVISYWM